MKLYNEICSCNPKNGGSGICGCTMANNVIDENEIITQYNYVQFENVYKKEVLDKIDILMDSMPHKQRGNPDSWSEYNQGWNDALNALKEDVEKL